MKKDFINIEKLIFDQIPVNFPVVKVSVRTMTKRVTSSVDLFPNTPLKFELLEEELSVINKDVDTLTVHNLEEYKEVVKQYRNETWQPVINDGGVFVLLGSKGTGKSKFLLENQIKEITCNEAEGYLTDEVEALAEIFSKPKSQDRVVALNSAFESFATMEGQLMSGGIPRQWGLYCNKLHVLAKLACIKLIIVLNPHFPPEEIKNYDTLVELIAGRCLGVFNRNSGEIHMRTPWSFANQDSSPESRLKQWLDNSSMKTVLQSSLVKDYLHDKDAATQERLLRSLRNRFELDTLNDRIESERMKLELLKNQYASISSDKKYKDLNLTMLEKRFSNLEKEEVLEKRKTAADDLYYLLNMYRLGSNMAYFGTLMKHVSETDDPSQFEKFVDEEIALIHQKASNLSEEDKNNAAILAGTLDKLMQLKSLTDKGKSFKFIPEQAAAVMSSNISKAASGGALMI